MHATTKVGAVAAAVRNRWRADLVLVWHLGLLKLLPFFRLPNARVVLWLHGIEAWRRQDRLTRAVLPRVNLFLSGSDYTWQRFTDANPECRGIPHRTVPLGLGEPSAEDPAQPIDPPAALVLSRLARSEAYKGHSALIDVWPLVLQRLPQAELWIAGEGDLRSDLERQSRDRGLDAQVRFWGYVSEQEKADLLGKARCFAMPSRKEGFGLVYLEAMRLGRPCLVSTVDAGREVVRPPLAGLAADPASLPDLAGAVVKLLTPGPQWSAWSTEARRRYETQFTAHHFQRRFRAALGLPCDGASSQEAG